MQIKSVLQRFIYTFTKIIRLFVLHLGGGYMHMISHPKEMSQAIKKVQKLLKVGKTKYGGDLLLCTTDLS